MKKMIFAAAMAAMTCAFAADEVKSADSGAEAAVAAETAKSEKKQAKRPARKPFDRAKFEARMREREAKRMAKTIEILKKYGLDDEKAKACAEELKKASRPAGPRRPAKPKAKPEEKPAE